MAEGKLFSNDIYSEYDHSSESEKTEFVDDINVKQSGDSKTSKNKSWRKITLFVFCAAILIVIIQTTVTVTVLVLKNQLDQRLLDLHIDVSKDHNDLKKYNTACTDNTQSVTDQQIKLLQEENNFLKTEMKNLQQKQNLTKNIMDKQFQLNRDEDLSLKAEIQNILLKQNSTDEMIDKQFQLSQDEDLSLKAQIQNILLKQNSTDEMIDKQFQLSRDEDLSLKAEIQNILLKQNWTDEMIDELQSVKEMQIQCLQEKNMTIGNINQSYYQQEKCQSGVFGEHAARPKWPAVKSITFSPPFSSIPSVVHGFMVLDSYKSTNVRAVVTASDITTEGFTLTLKTWSDTVQYGLIVRWMACL